MIIKCKICGTSFNKNTIDSCPICKSGYSVENYNSIEEIMRELNLSRGDVNIAIRDGIHKLSSPKISKKLKDYVNNEN